MRKLIAPLVGAVLLAGCTMGPPAPSGPSSGANPTPPGSAALTSAWNIACGVYSQAKASWDTAVGLGLIQLDPGATRWNGASEASLDAACTAQTPPTDLRSATALITAATSAMLLEVAKAHQGQPAVKVPALKL